MYFVFWSNLSIVKQAQAVHHSIGFFSDYMIKEQLDTSIQILLSKQRVYMLCTHNISLLYSVFSSFLDQSTALEVKKMDSLLSILLL
jgi:hypothetical protein